MIIIKIVGGLGNQMFQYAYAKMLESKGYKVKIDTFAFDRYKLHGGYQLDKYNIDLEESSKEENNKYYSNFIFNRILGKIGINTSKKIKEKSLLFDKSLLNIEDNNYIEGYFQNEEYFKNIRNILIEQFTITYQLSKYTKKIKNKILLSENSCSIHIRRGDFINSSNINIHGSCELKYYRKAVNYIEKNKKNIKYFVFSDDIKWCKENIEIKNVLFIDSKERRLPHEDIYLMSLCCNNIIANSSFSWWGAWLNNNKEKIVIGPTKWFVDNKLQSQGQDIVCEKWIKL